MQERREFITSAVAVVATTLATPLVVRAADQIWSDVELCLGFDVSGSMPSGYLPDGRSHALVQKQGHQSALEYSKIRQALVDQQAIVRIIAWSGKETQLDLSDGGVLIRSDADVTALKRLIEDRVPLDKSLASGTVHYKLLQFVVGLERTSSRLVLDVSTDESPSNGKVCRRFRDEIGALRGQVNALAIDKIGYTSVKSGCEASIQTANGFTVGIQSFKDYPAAVRKKLIWELAAN